MALKGDWRAYHQAQLFNLKGVLVQTLPLDGGRSPQFSVADWAEGAYLLRLQRPDGTSTTLKFSL